LVYADELLRIDPLSPLSLLTIAHLDLRLGRFAEMERTLERLRSIDPKSVSYLWESYLLAISRGDLVGAISLLEDSAKADPADSSNPSLIAMYYFDLGDGVAAKYWSEAALKVDPRAPWAKLVSALLHLDRHEEAEAAELAREITQPGALTLAVQGAALRIANAPNLAAGHYAEIITEYLTDYPELRDAKVPVEFSAYIWEGLIVTLDLASVYLQAGEEAKAESLLSAAESEIPH
jgi:tetratricopeptide (TPR) repeat protein